MNQNEIIDRLNTLIDSHELEVVLYEDSGIFFDSIDPFSGLQSSFDHKDAIYIYLEDGSRWFERETGIWSQPDPEDYSYMRILENGTIEYTNGSNLDFTVMFIENDIDQLIIDIEYMICVDTDTDEELRQQLSEKMSNI